MPEGQISVSEDKLYRALAETKSDIIKSFTEIVAPLEARVRALELQYAGQNAVQENTKFKQAKIPTLIAAVVGAIISALAQHFSIH